MHTPESSPEHDLSNPKSRGKSFTLVRNGWSGEEDSQYIQSSPCERVAECIEEEEDQQPSKHLKRIAPLEERGLGAQLLQLSIGTTTRPTRRHYVYPVNGKGVFCLKLRS
jgi:hypothetical protein